MKTKHLFASAVMAAVLAGCSQDEPIVMNNDNLGDRPMVEAPSLTIGGVESRMTAEEVTAAGFANVKWAEGDGFGAAVMDSYVPGGETWDEMFPIQNYISSNVLFKTEDGKNFYADASMPMGNHLFYAPFNLTNISRAPLATQLPLEQIVVPTTNGMPSNSAIAAFFEDETSPVFVAYDKVTDEPKTSLDLEMRHIYSLPLVTLELGDVNLLNEEGEFKGVYDEEGVLEELIYEETITVDSIKFVNNNKIVTRGSIKNAKIQELLAKTEDGVVWDANKYEDAATSDIVEAATASETVNPYEEIVVKFEGGLELTKENGGKFFMVLPGAAYDAEDLKVLVYTTINGEAYVSAEDSKAVAVASISAARDLRLLPGLPYAADEYNADGTKKESAGTSMTYTVSGGFIPVDEAEEEVVVAEYVQIATYEQLVSYVKNVAYRGVALQQLTAEAAKALVEADSYDAKAQFVITATEEAPIALVEGFVEIFKNACVIKNGEAEINFISGKNVVLGDMTWTKDASELINFNDAAYAAGEVVLKANPATTVNVLSNATVTLDAAIEEAVVINNNENGTVNLNSAKTHQIVNGFGTLNVNIATSAEIINGSAAFNEDENNFGLMNIADNVVVAVENNNLTGKIEINYAEVAISDNSGKVEMKDADAELTVAAGNGEVNNTIGAKVYAESNTVYANVSSLDLRNYDLHTNLNKLVLNGILTSDKTEDIENDKAKQWSEGKIKTIDFVEGSGINYGIIAGRSLDLSKVETINILADVEWIGRDVESTSVIVKPGAIKEAEDCELTLTRINVWGYETVVSDQANLKKAIKAGGNVTLNGDIEISALTNDQSIILGDVVLNLNGYSLNMTAGNMFRVNGSLTIDGEGSIISNDYIASVNEGGVITVNGGDFEASTTCFQSNGGELYITGGTFNAYNDEYKGVYTINFIDAMKEVGKIEISGGDFFNFNPYASKSENPADNFVKSGCTVKVLKEDGTYGKTYNKPYTETVAFNNGEDLIYQVR